MKPLAIELFAGLHGWGEGFITEGYRVIGFDIVDMCAALGRRRPAGIELVIQDVLTLHGSQFRDAAVIVASPPCQAYSYMAMPWKRSKALADALRSHPSGLDMLNTLFDTCFRIQREASEAAGHHVPLIVENVKGAQPWVGRAKWHFGSYYLWGDVPALMPPTVRAQKFNPDGTTHPPGSWFAIADSNNRGSRATKNNGGSRFAVAHNTESGHEQNPVTGEDGLKNARKAASAQIAKIPFGLAQWIERCYAPSPHETPFRCSMEHVNTLIWKEVVADKELPEPRWAARHLLG